jgi:hypothetical protein
MTGWLARQTLRLYPLAYQRRYGEEMRALLEDQPAGAGTAFDLLKGAARAHLRPADAPAGVVDAQDRVRASTSGVLLCWVLFAAAGFGYAKTTEDQPFSVAGHAHPLLRDAHVAVQAVALIASAAVVLGAMPLIIAAFGRARRDPSFRGTAALPFLPLVVFGGLTAVVVAMAHNSAGGSGIAVVWGIAGLVCGTTCVLACRRALFATPAGAAGLRTALAAGTVVTVAMLVIAAATALYTVALSADVSRVAAEPNGPFQLLSVTASLIVQLVVMVGAGALASVATVRAWRVERQLA